MRTRTIKSVIVDNYRLWVATLMTVILTGFGFINGTTVDGLFLLLFTVPMILYTINVTATS